MKLTLEQVKNNPYVKEYIKQTEIALRALGFTEHGQRHSDLVSKRAYFLAQKIGLSKEQRELAAIAGYLHDFGNFLGRNQHHYWGALLASQIFGNKLDPKNLSILIQAIANHDKYEMKFTSKVSAILVLADKSDVHFTRVVEPNGDQIKADIHDRVNFATKENKIEVDKKEKKIKLELKIETDICPVMEYFEIFTERMAYCREAANYLGYSFNLVINNFNLL